MMENDRLEKAKKELKDLIINFNSNFSKKEVKPSAKEENIDCFALPENVYPKPEIDENTKNKIAFLAKIAAAIEKKSLNKVEDKTELNETKIDYKNSLNKEQFSAVSTTEGPVLVIAGAGSGKTRTIIYRLAYLLEKGIEPEKILLLTFTRKAAKEMIERANHLLENDGIKKVLGGTFHSFANYLLRKYHKLINIPPNFTIIDVSDSEDVIDLIRQELKFAKKEKAFPRKSRIQTIISKSRNCGLSINEVIDREYKGLTDFVPEIQIINQVYGEYKQANNLLDYDDLLESIRDALRDNLFFRNKIQNDFLYIMVDEFQDTNIVQKEIIDLIAEKNKNIMVVGDDAQSIYAFRGANVENILKFPETYSECQVIKLEKNYRSNQDILNFTNEVINKAIIGYKKNLVAVNAKKGKPIVRKFYSQEDEAKFIVEKILDLRENNIPLNQVAVLFRSSFHSNFIQAELLKRNIPYLVYGGLKFTERRHVKDIIGYLRIILNPLDAVSWNRILKLLPGVGSTTASKLIKDLVKDSGKINWGKYQDKKFYPLLKELEETLEMVAKEEITIYQKINTIKKYYQPLLKTLESDYKTRMLDLDVLNILAEKYEKLEKFLSDFALDPPSDKFQDKSTPQVNESEDKPLILSTIHSAKGLEWHTVFVTHLLDGLLPSAASFAKIEDLEEERRLFYVACTRAKEKLYLTLPAYVQSWDSFFTYPTRFFSEINRSMFSAK